METIKYLGEDYEVFSSQFDSLLSRFKAVRKLSWGIKILVIRIWTYEDGNVEIEKEHISLLYDELEELGKGGKVNAY